MTLQERAAPTRQETRISKVRERTICLSFGSHRVVIESNAGEVLEGLTAVVSPMIACDARGEIAATFRVIRAGKDFVIQGSDGNDEAFTDPRQATRVLYHRAVKALIDARPDLLWVHAAAASLERQAILLSGPSGQGKSTLIAELLGRDILTFQTMLRRLIRQPRPCFLFRFRHTNAYRHNARYPRRRPRSSPKLRSRSRPKRWHENPARSAISSSFVTPPTARLRPSHPALPGCPSSSCCEIRSVVEKSVRSRLRAFALS